MNFRKFWEPGDFRGHCIKWLAILLPILISVYLFLHMLEPIRAYERACRNPVIVEAEKQVVPYHTDFTGATYYDILLSYEYDGVSYSGIYYHYSKNPSALWEEPGHVRVAINPEHPEVLVRHMLRKTPVELSVAFWTLGLSLLIYALALKIPAFLSWRIRAANKPAFLSRPYGKPKPEVCEPDYLKDIALLLLPVFAATILILSFIFPYTFSISH